MGPLSPRDTRAANPFFSLLAFVLVTAAHCFPSSLVRNPAVGDPSQICPLLPLCSGLRCPATVATPEASESSIEAFPTLDGSEDPNWIRRCVLRRGAVLANFAVLATPPLVASAKPTTTSVGDDEGLDCLLDLPPVPPNRARIYLCRHGQTEENRRGLVTPQSDDPDLNGIGRRESLRIGKALGRLPVGTSRPKIVVHSGSRRSSETARLVLKEIMGDRAELSKLPTLSRVNFCLATKGQHSQFVRNELQEALRIWDAGQLDVPAGGGGCGETGRDALRRASDALGALARLAHEDGNGSILAVSHSTFLGVVLSAAMGAPLVEAASLSQENGCINILDVSKNGYERTTWVSPFGGGGFGSIAFPRVEVVRVNEVRHLQALF